MTSRLLLELRLRPKDFIDKSLFIAFASVGIVALFAAKSIGLSQATITSGLVGGILVYLLAGIALGRVKLRPDQVGDNCYYLGFIYTLGSLGYTLYVFTGDAAGVRTIISNFGIALLTTMVGIVLRVVLHQWRQDPGDIEQEARIALAEAALRLRGELDEVVLNMSSFRSATQQSIAEAFDEIAVKAGAVLTGAAASFEAVSTKAIERIDTSFNAFSADAERLGKSSGEVVGSLETLIQRIGRIEAPADLVQTKIAPAIGKIGDLVSLLEARAQRDDERVKNVDALVASVAASSADTERAAVAIRQRAEEMSGALGGFSALGAEAERLTQSMDKAVEAARLLAEEQRRAVEEMRPAVASALQSIREEERQAVDGLTPQVAAALQSVTESAGTAVKELSGSVREETQRAADELRAIGEASRAETRRAVDALVAELRASAESAARHREEISAHSERIREVQRAILQDMGRLGWTVKRSEEPKGPEDGALRPAPKNGHDAQPAGASGPMSWFRLRG